ncbi:hypothetical protein CRV08_13755 [Halarcobacter ebronensis]|uniref:Uncharacterized protein n=1 Tax=Halarcobacter ebronensis TaxID=1462615 RepID=A0A4Q0Y8L5_9BACT|nr:hypothetical protein [Halarcobacter ebronensis]RXJ66233.1 hypothetical protein CRV08_13755 [Halarcobacter ebronensis]
MPIMFTSHVEQDEKENWYIQLTDPIGHKSATCKSLDEYKIKLEEFSSDYGFDIEVVWSKSKDLSLENIEDLNKKMALLQEEYETEIAELNR